MNNTCVQAVPRRTKTCFNDLERYLCAGAWAHLHFYEWRNFPFYLKGGSDRIKWNIIQDEFDDSAEI